MAQPRIPIVVLTGFLGSGKTTVLKHLGRSGHLGRTLVLVNEFGEVGLDHHLLSPIADDTLVAINSGCICCTIRADLAQTLAAAPTRYSRGGECWFDRVVIETTGIADPAPVLQTILGGESVSRKYVLTGVVTTVDAVNGLASIEAHDEALKQVAVADRILLTKTDLVSAQEQARLTARLSQIAPTAPVCPVLDGKADIDWLFPEGVYTVNGKLPDVDAWLRADDQAGHPTGHAHAHEPDLNRHGQIHASCLTFAEPVDPAALDAALQSLMMFRGADLLRVKGIVNVMGMDKPMVIHGVQHVFHPPEVLDDWPGSDRRTRIVLIARDIDHHQLRACFAGMGLEVESSPM